MRAFAWAVLTLVFLDEVACIVALGVWGWSVGGTARWVLVVAAPVAAMAAWYLLAAPKAPYGGSIIRPVTKLIVFGVATLALSDAGHRGWALALLACSLVVNGLAQLPDVRRVVAEAEGRPQRA